MLSTATWSSITATAGEAVDTQRRYEESGGPLRWATAVASRDGDLVAYDSGEVVEHAGLLHHWFLLERRPPLAITGSEVLGVVPLEVTDALLGELRRLADRHERGVVVEQVMELLDTS